MISKVKGGGSPSHEKRQDGLAETGDGGAEDADEERAFIPEGRISELKCFFSLQMSNVNELLSDYYHDLKKFKFDKKKFSNSSNCSSTLKH